MEEPILIIQERTLNIFILETVKYLAGEMGLQAIEEYMKPGNNGNIQVFKKDCFRLTGMFLSADEEELNRRNARSQRWFEEPFQLGGRTVYLTNQWNAKGDWSLTLPNFIKMIQTCYGEMYFYKQENGEHRLYMADKEDDVYIERTKKEETVESPKKEEPTPKKEEIEQLPFQMSALLNSIKGTGLLYEDNLIKRYACSLMTKPFVILSGLAGSGKTQLALAFAHAMSEDVTQQLCVVPVGADWTNREPLLGYPNALKLGEYVKPESGALQLMMRALRNPQKPYFLVLDEMNLSYVERYFADFLSALESHQEIPLWEKPDECDSEVPAKIALPKNLFITGTINVDETTYMFSPKVLDRANVIEFKISEQEMEDFLTQDMNGDIEKANGKCANMGKNFVERATSKEIEKSDFANNTLVAFFKELKKVNAEFGYRTATEIYRFIANAKICAEDMQEEDLLDASIVQKLLPKLHGSRKKLEPVLKALWKLSMTEEHKDDEINCENVGNAKFKKAADKIQRMMQTALDNGFTSFAEA